MGKKSCLYIPFVGGNREKPSNLYRDFLKKVGGDRSFTNLIYAAYLQDGVAEAMDKLGYRRDNQGEHKAKDVYTFFNVPQMRSEAGIAIDSFAKSEGIMDSAGNPVDFDALTAFHKAQDINSKSIGRVAYVLQHGDKFNVFLETKDSRTQFKAEEVNLQMLEWQTIEEAFGKVGVDLTAAMDAFPSLVNPLNSNLLLQTLQSISDVSAVRYLSKRDIGLLLHFGNNAPFVQNLLKRGWGNLEETALKAYDVLHNKAKYGEDTYNVVVNALNQGKDINGKLIAQLKKDLDENVEPKFLAHSKDYDIKQTLEELNEKYKLNTDVLVLHDRNIRKLSEAAAHAMVTLNRQLEHLEREGKGTPQQEENIRKQLYQLSKEIEGKRYYSGLLGFTQKALEYAQKIQKSLQSIPTTGTMMEYVSARANVLATAKTMQDSYGFIVNSLANLDTLLIDENITDADKKALQDVAQKVKKDLETQENIMQNLREQTMIDLCTEIFGNNVVEGKAVADIVAATEADSSIMDYLYSVGRQSNPLVGAMGTVIRDAQLSRDRRLAEVSLRIRRITDKLYAAGHNSEFMYEWVTDKNGEHGRYYIVSDIDWKEYNKARNEQYGRLYASGLRGIELKEAMRQWIEANTKEITYGTHVERIPVFHKTEDFMTGWDDAQIEYYNEMMKIKGEIGSLLPQYAQYQFLPPQRRADLVDIINKGRTNKMSLKEVSRNILDRLNPIKLRQSDTQYGMLVDGDEYIESRGDFDGTSLRQIPVFYTMKLRDQNDLVMDFSGAMQSLAHTAINYDEMNGIKDTVEMMGDFIKSKAPSAKRNGMTQAELVETQGVHVLSKLKEHARRFGIEDLVDGFIEKHIYGIEMKDTGVGWRTVQALINYTSLNQLAPNLKGGLSNFFVGEHQMLIEAVAGSIGKRAGSEIMYSLRDYAKAQAMMFGTKLNPGVLMDHLSNDVSSMPVLLADRFDPLDDLAQEYGDKRYYQSAFRQMIGGFNAMGIYSVGEAAIHYVNMYAVLFNEKVRNGEGKEVSLYEAFDKTEKKDGSSDLIIKDGYTKLDGSAIDDAYLNTVKDRIRTINQNTHGSMNREDKGLIHRRMAGRAVMNFRQWMVEHYSRRYRSRHWDASQRKFVEGYFNTVFKIAQSYLSDYVSFVNDANAHWDELDAAQKNNVWKACAEVTLLGALLCLSGALGDPDDHKREYWYRMAIYQVRRLILDEEASIPPIPFLTGGFVSEGVKLLNSPVASVKTFNGILYPITGVRDINKTIQSGRYEGWNKYLRNVLKLSVPFYNQIDQTIHLGDEGYSFAIFDQRQ